MSKQQTSATSDGSSKPSLNKKTILEDLIAFGSIISAYLFVSFSFKIDFIAPVLGLSLDNPGQIILLYLIYILHIIIFKLLAFVSKWRTQAEGEVTLLQTLKGGIQNSMISVLLISAIYLFGVAVSTNKLTLEGQSLLSIGHLSHIAFWLLSAEIASLWGVLIGYILKLETLTYFGQTLRIILAIMGVASLLGIDSFVFL